MWWGFVSEVEDVGWVWEERIGSARVRIERGCGVLSSESAAWICCDDMVGADVREVRDVVVVTDGA